MTAAEYCADCARIVGVGCVCGVPFADRIKGQTFSLGTFKAVRG
jgi:hypothetical protein